jgi:hypothetical protein
MTDFTGGGGGGGGGGDKATSSASSSTSGNNFGGFTTPDGGLNPLAVMALAAFGLVAFLVLIVVSKK